MPNEVLTRVALIIRELGITQAAFACQIGFPASDVNKVVNGHKSPSMNMAIKIHEEYSYSIEYILGLSEDKKDEASRILDELSRIFDKITTTPKTYIDKNGNHVKGQFLMFSMNESLYEFLVEIDHAAERQEQGMKSYIEETHKIKQEFIRNKDEGKMINCILIPSNQLIEIIDSDNRNRQAMDEILSLDADSQVYLDEEAETRLTKKQ